MSLFLARMALEKEERRLEEEEEQKYAKSTMEELMRLCVKCTNINCQEGGLDGWFYKNHGLP